MSDARVHLPYPRPRPYNPGPTLPPTPISPPIQREPLFQHVADLVRLVEVKFPKLGLSELLAVAKCLEDKHRLVNNIAISDVEITRKNQEFSRGDSWFHVQWWEHSSNGYDRGDPFDRKVFRSVNLRFEPGPQICTSHEVDEPSQQGKTEILVQTPESMDLDTPKHEAKWSGLVGDLFQEAAGIAADQLFKPQTLASPRKNDEEPSMALWPTRAWSMIATAIWGFQTSRPGALFTFPVPYFPSLHPLHPM
jgi:hypothetical protein